METATLTLADFLLARIAEDEAVARAAVIPAHDGYKPHPELSAWQYAPYGPDCTGEVEYAQTPEMLDHKYPEALYVTCDSEGLSPAVREDAGPHIARHDPARVMAECEAKRAVVRLHQGEHHCTTHIAPEDNDPCETLAALALAYSDHPDYRADWS